MRRTRFFQICLLLASCGAIVSACNYEGTSIQRKYVSDRKDCRNDLEMMFDPEMLQSRDDRIRARINNMFNQCMIEKHHWLMSTKPSRARGD